MRLWGVFLTSPLTPSSFAIQPLCTDALSTGIYSLKHSACAAPTLQGRTPPGTGKPPLTDKAPRSAAATAGPGTHLPRTTPRPPDPRPPPPPAHAGGQRGPARPAAASPAGPEQNKALAAEPRLPLHARRHSPPRQRLRRPPRREARNRRGGTQSPPGPP